MKQRSVQCYQSLWTSALLDALKDGFISLFGELWRVGNVWKAHDDGNGKL